MTVLFQRLAHGQKLGSLQVIDRAVRRRIGGIPGCAGQLFVKFADGFPVHYSLIPVWMKEVSVTPATGVATEMVAAPTPVTVPVCATAV